MMEEEDSGRLDLGMDSEDMMGALSEKNCTYHVQKVNGRNRGQENGTSVTKDDSYSSKERYHKTCQLSFFFFFFLSLLVKILNKSNGLKERVCWKR